MQKLRDLLRNPQIYQKIMKINVLSQKSWKNIKYYRIIVKSLFSFKNQRKSLICSDLLRFTKIHRKLNDLSWFTYICSNLLQQPLIDRLCLIFRGIPWKSPGKSGELLRTPRNDRNPGFVTLKYMNMRRNCGQLSTFSNVFFICCTIFRPLFWDGGWGSWFSQFFIFCQNS